MEIVTKETYDTIAKELEEESISPTLDNIMVEFIKFNMEVYRDCNGGATKEDSKYYIQSGEFIETIQYYIEEALKTLD